MQAPCRSPRNRLAPLACYLGHNAYKRGTRAYCGTCEQEFVFTEEKAYQTITGQTAEEAAAFFKQRKTIAAKWHEAPP